jgi:uncharacterized protein (TIGR02569 family)
MADSHCPAGVPAEVLAAFGLDGAVPARLAGGQGTAWRAGRAVLKPADSDQAGRWFADVYDTLSGPGFRVPRPLRALTGDWVAQGWTAYQWVPGTAADWSGVSPRWPDLVAVSRALHAALAGVAVPSWRAAVENEWTIGDEVAWGERDPGPLLGPAAGPLAGQVRLLLASLRPVARPAQLVHADLGGNVLFADGLPPAVIDFSPLERPAGLPLAIAAVDALLWRRARPEVLGQLAGEPELGQLLARALIYRLVTEIVRHAGTPGVEAAARAARPVTELVAAYCRP